MMPMTGNWTSDSVRALRLRLGFSTSDMARRLGCDCEKVRAWEIGILRPQDQDVDGLVLLSKQAEVLSEELSHKPVLDQIFDHSEISQIDLLDLKR